MFLREDMSGMSAADKPNVGLASETTQKTKISIIWAIEWTHQRMTSCVSSPTNGKCSFLVACGCIGEYVYGTESFRNLQGSRYTKRTFICSCEVWHGRLKKVDAAVFPDANCDLLSVMNCGLCLDCLTLKYKEKRMNIHPTFWNYDLKI